MDLLNFIGGEFVPAMGAKKVIKLSPFTGEILAEVAFSDAMDVVMALQSARKGAAAWSEISPEERSQFLARLADALERNASKSSFAEALHQGLSQTFVEKNSLRFAVAVLREQVQLLQNSSSENHQVRPSGIVGIIGSWCLSLRLIVERMAPALAAGNVCIVKVSEHSPITVQILGEALREAGFPPGVVTLLQGGEEVAQAIAGHPGIRAITAIGKNSTLERIAKAGLSQFKKMQHSGSVKNASVVLAGTDFQSQMAEILEPFLMGQGQLCWNVSRIFVPEAEAASFIEAAKTYLEKLTPLQDPSGSEYWSPLIEEKACLEIHEKVQGGVQEHGKVLFGGARLEGGGFFYKPTLMLDLPNCSTLQQDELKGPLLLVTPVKYQHEAVKWANLSYLGHSAIVWGPEEKARKVASQLDYGYISLNTWELGRGLFGLKQSSFGNPDMNWSGTFYSDVKKLAGHR